MLARDISSQTAIVEAGNAAEALAVIDLHPDDTLLEAAELFSRYSFRTIPITDENRVILGVIPYRDIMNLKHRFV